MSAGTGLTHSEFNDSKIDEVNFLQLWILPEAKGVSPNYEQRKFNTLERHNKLQTVVAPQNKLEGEALPIHQQAYIYRLDLEAGASVDLVTKDAGNGFYVFIEKGALSVADQNLKDRDAIGVWETDAVELKASENSNIIIIEVPMN
jgi:redox-sensitive bicupin YhaK (pirin superfamily)